MSEDFISEWGFYESTVRAYQIKRALFVLKVYLSVVESCVLSAHASNRTWLRSYLPPTRTWRRAWLLSPKQEPGATATPRSRSRRTARLRGENGVVWCGAEVVWCGNGVIVVIVVIVMHTSTRLYHTSWLRFVMKTHNYEKTQLLFIDLQTLRYQRPPHNPPSVSHRQHAILT